METLSHNPTEGIYPATDDYVHALEVRGAARLIFVSGAMGLDAAGRPPATLDEQLELVWSNVPTILAAAGLTVDHVVRLTSFLTDASYAEAIRGLASRRWAGGSSRRRRSWWRPSIRAGSSRSR